MSKIDWTNKNQVIEYAKRLEGAHVVFKHPERDNYNITHLSRIDRYEKDWVVFRKLEHRRHESS